jgi:hypothetical protein
MEVFQDPFFQVDPSLKQTRWTLHSTHQGTRRFRLLLWQLADRKFTYYTRNEAPVRQDHKFHF